MRRMGLKDALRSLSMVVLATAATSPAWAQQSAPANAAPASDASQDAAISQPPAAPASDAARRAADDAQLPAYLRSHPEGGDGATYDPWEHYNRGVFRFNKGIDNALLKPLATAYVDGVPEPLRNRVTDFFANLRQPATAVNLLLQGHPGPACSSVGRFAIDTTIGIGGLFDPATPMHIPAYEEDFGLTLGHWGWRQSRYLLLPFMPPGSLRDRIGSLADSGFGPIGYIRPWEWRVPVIGLEVLDVRAELLPLDEMGTGVEDEYVLVREAWSQRRMHQLEAPAPLDGNPTE